MGKSLGIHLTGRIVTGVVEGQKPCSRLFHFPEDTDDTDALLDTPLEGLIDVVREQAVRAVGAANGRNPLPIVLPCHRVIGADGSLTGFGGGLPTKRFLLALEERVANGDLFA